MAGLLKAGPQSPQGAPSNGRCPFRRAGDGVDL